MLIMANNVFLIIGADAENLRIILKNKEAIKEEVFKGNARDRAELAIISGFLESQNLTPQDIGQIAAIIHDQAKTSVRVIQVIVKTLAWFNGISVREIKSKDLFALDKTELIRKMPA